MLSKLLITCGACKTPIRGRGRQFKRIDSISGKVNYVGSFQSDVDEATEKTRKKAGMILNGCTDRKNTNLLKNIKLWRQACLRTLLFGSVLWILRQTQLLELERCQSWFLGKEFHPLKFCDNAILTKISGL